MLIYTLLHANLAFTLNLDDELVISTSSKKRRKENRKKRKREEKEKTVVLAIDTSFRDRRVKPHSVA